MVQIRIGFPLKSILISEYGKREFKNAFRKHWKKYFSVSVNEKRKTENGKGKKTVSQTLNLDVCDGVFWFLVFGFWFLVFGVCPFLAF
jgi:hypothetical protein